MELRKLAQQIVQLFCDLGLEARHVDALEHEGDALEARTDGVELLLKELGDPGQYVDVVDQHEREGEIAAVDQHGALGKPGHLELALVGRRTDGTLDALGERIEVLDGATEGGGHPFQGEIVVGGTDPAGGEDQVVGVGHGAHVQCDGLDLVGDGDDALHVDAQGAQLPTQIGRVGVDHLPGEDLVADHQDSRRGHPFSIGYAALP